MTDIIWVVSSSVLILAVLAVRAIFGKKLGAGLRYALWTLVVLRLLIPGTVFQSPISVKSAVTRTEIGANIEAVKEFSSVMQSGTEAVAEHRANKETVTVIRGVTPEQVEGYRKTIRVRDVLNIVWYTGTAMMAAYLIYVNTRFYLKLRERRTRLETNAPCRVYSVEGIESSCLFLNTIYVSKESAEDPEKLNCVIAHELSHRRHGDGVWTLLRCACLTMHWYNPLVWYAAFASRQDSELFADAGAVRSLGENMREGYGRTLIELSARPSVRASIACTATTMANNKRALKERVRSIAAGRRTGLLIAAVVLVICLAAAGCTFIGSSETGKPNSYETQAGSLTTDEPASPTDAPTEEPTAAPTEEPTAAPTAEPTAAPVPDDWFIDNAKLVEQDIRLLYGLDPNPIYGIERHGDGESGNVVVHFGSLYEDDIPYMEMQYVPGTEGGSDWVLERVYAHIPGEEDLKRIADDRDVFGSYFDYDVTPDQLAEAGYTQTSGEAGAESAVAYILDGLAARFTHRPEDDTLLCSDAKSVSISYDSSYEDGGAMIYNYDGLIAALPLHPRSFELGFSEASYGWLYLGEAHPECRYYQGIAVLLSAKQNADGTFHVYAEIPILETGEGD